MKDEAIKPPETKKKFPFQQKEHPSITATRNSKKTRLEVKANRAGHHGSKAERDEKKRKEYREDPRVKERMRGYRKKHVGKIQKAAARSKAYLPGKHMRRDRNCPTCGRPLPNAIKPRTMVIGKRYEVAMFPISELARRLQKQVRTLILWVEKGVMPETQYKDPSRGQRLWTQDQIEVITAVADQYHLSPPVNYVKCGFVGELKAALDKLRPLGIDSKKYTAKGAIGEGQFLARPDPIKPTDYEVAYTELVESEKKGRKPKKEAVDG